MKLVILVVLLAFLLAVVLVHDGDPLGRLLFQRRGRAGPLPTAVDLADRGGHVVELAAHGAHVGQVAAQQPRRVPAGAGAQRPPRQPPRAVLEPAPAPLEYVLDAPQALVRLRHLEAHVQPHLVVPGQERGRGHVAVRAEAEDGHAEARQGRGPPHVGGRVVGLGRPPLVVGAGVRGFELAEPGQVLDLEHEVEQDVGRLRVRRVGHEARDVDAPVGEDVLEPRGHVGICWRCLLL
ncbi:hypothetical protein GGTG_09024 [Gaeumannomyces tritici R3-111a-1]|uniref:Secreted protein n=1 Tax=Gaeumannomyces tritici (strain R3-111a-1) TaxID=644352 RepID=J3P683_GAET3|nr:hypothetical protein GGTG_09024 [Gaeumannomyces tritici R3-111a-1]EJT72157.1 hypothetical protein GGTG_09024 [Gaeumannomyces tritici R3-111a-1]